MAEGGEHSQLPVPANDAASLAASRRNQAVAALAALEGAKNPLEDYIGLFLRRKWTFLAALAVVFGVTCAFTAKAPRVYQASATMLVTEPKGPGGSAASALQGDLPGVGAMAAPDLDTHIALIQSRSTAEATAAWLKTHGGPTLSSSLVEGAVSASVVPDTNLVKVQAHAGSPREAQAIANATAAAYAELNRSRAQGSSESASKYLSEQMAVAKRNLNRAQVALQQFEEATHTVQSGTADVASNLLSREASLQSDIDGTRASLVQGEAQLARVREDLRQQNRSISASQVRDDAAVQSLRAQLVSLEGQKLVAQSQYTSALSAPVDQIDQQIKVVKDQLHAAIQNVVRSGSGDLTTQANLVGQVVSGEESDAALTARLHQSQSELAKVKQELQKVPARQVNVARLQGQVDVAQGIYSDLLKQSQQVEVSRVMALGNTDVVESAALPHFPIKPNVPLNLVFGLLFGLAVGVGLALLQEQLDDTVRGEEDVAQFAEAPVLGTVPVLAARDVAFPLPKSPARSRVFDAYRGLRVNLGFVTPGRGAHIVLVTSPGPQEGKSTTSLHLAVAAAQSGRKVILIDADLRRPSLHRYFKARRAFGLSDVLAGQAELKDVLQEVDSGALQLIGAGTQAPNPTDLLDSEEMRRLLAAVRAQADLVIVDSPPVLAAADALVLAHLSEAVLMVCVPGASHRRALQRARLLLDQVGRPVSGVVLNKVEHKPGYGYYGYYGYGHYYGHDSEADGDGAEADTALAKTESEGRGDG